MIRTKQMQLKALYGVIALFMVIFFISLVEGCFYVYNMLHQKKITVAGDILEKGFFQEDDALGYKPKPNMRVTAIYKENEKIIYNAVYTTDACGRRTVPEYGEKRKKKFYALFFGCSYTFGEGLQDNETLPFYYSLFQPSAKPYNYGLSGYGPQQMLEHLKRENIKDEIAEQQGILIYTFIDHHINRVIGTMRSYSLWADIMPYYVLDQSNNLVRKGSFRTGRPFLNKIYWLLNRSQVVKALNLDYPRINKKHFELTARMFLESQKIFYQKFGSDKYYILFYPGSRYVQNLKPYLQKFGISYLDYSGLFNPSDSLYHIPGDVHPNSHALKLIAEKIAQDIALFDRPVQ